MQYDVDFHCGHTATVNLVGPHKDRERRIEYYEQSGVCPDCYKKQKDAERKREYDRIRAIEKDYETPDLSGSDKQVAWANKIRFGFIEDFQRVIDRSNNIKLSLRPDQIEKFEKEFEGLLQSFSRIINGETGARYWIDNRAVKLQVLIADHGKKEAIESTPEAQEAKAESVMVPVKVSHTGAVEIAITGETVKAEYQIDDSFYSIVKRFRFRWGGHCWERACTEYSGSAADRAAELANVLLSDGFSVSCMDEDVRRRAQQADFIPECRRWIKFCPSEKMFTIIWDREDDDLYNSARSLPGGRWDREAQRIVVPGRSWREVLDFANINCFMLSAAAQKAAETFKSAEISVIPAQPKKHPEKDKLKDILSSSTEVLSDLKDD